MHTDPVVITNLALSVVTSLLSGLSYSRSREKLPLWMSVAFGLFAIANLLNLVETGGSVAQIIVYAIGFVALLLALVGILSRSQRQIGTVITKLEKPKEEGED